MAEGWGILDVAGGGADFADGFNRSGALGSPWHETTYDVVNFTTVADYWGCDGSHATISTAVVISSTGMPQFAWIDSATPDGTITVTMTDAAGSPGLVGIAFGIDPSTGSAWRASGSSLDYMANYASTPASYLYGTSLANGDELSVVLLGQDITVKRNGTPVLVKTGVRTTARGGSIQNAGIFGFPANVKLDDFSWAPSTAESWD